MVVDRALAAGIEDNYAKWSGDPRYKTWMTRPEYRNFIGAREPMATGRDLSKTSTLRRGKIPTLLSAHCLGRNYVGIADHFSSFQLPMSSAVPSIPSGPSDQISGTNLSCLLGQSVVVGVMPRIKRYILKRRPIPFDLSYSCSCTRKSLQALLGCWDSRPRPADKSSKYIHEESDSDSYSLHNVRLAVGGRGRVRAVPVFRLISDDVAVR